MNPMPGIYVAVVVAAFLRYLQTRERKLLLVLVLFGLIAVAQSEGHSRRFAGVFHLAAGLTGCALVVTLAPYPPRR
jgi:hypothetical protein